MKRGERITKYEDVGLEASAYYPDLEIPDQRTYVEIISRKLRK